MILFMDKSLHLLLLTNSYVSNEDGFVTVSQMTDRRRKTSHHYHVYALKRKIRTSHKGPEIDRIHTWKNASR